jgi:PKD repeat protein
VVTHTFAEGSSTVSLTVTDDDGASDTASRSLIVPIPNQPPFAAFDVTCVHLACEFRDASTDSDGVVADHSWDFGDGSGSAATNPSHAYDAEGTYHVTLTVTDDAGDVNAASTTLAVAPNAPPVAEFDVSCAGRRCTFTDRSSDPDGGIAARSWESGDGAVSSQSEFVHTYGADGAYTATLRVADAAGLEDAASREVLVANAPPEASFSWSCANLACQFTDASSDAEGDLAARAWDFGDGGTSQAADPAHSYAGAGDYVVTLTVRDGDGAEDAEVRTLTVSAPPVFTLSARGYRVRRKHRVDLTWSGARTPTVDMYRNGARKGSGWVNDGFQTDRMSATGKATYDYRICEAGTQVCSNTVRVVF